MVVEVVDVHHSMEIRLEVLVKKDKLLIKELELKVGRSPATRSVNWAEL